jgi:hypothetical protein
MAQINLIMMVFMFPETRYIREADAQPQSVEFSGLEKDALPREDDKEINVTNTTDPDMINKVGHNSRDIVTSSDTSVTQSTSEFLGRGRPGKAQFSFFQKIRFEGKEMLARDALAPFQIFTVPIISWAAMSMGFAANCLLGLNLTQSQVFAAPPYNFTSAQVGFVNFAFVVGGIIGLLTAGPLSDFISLRAAKKNGGVREPEMRLIALFPYIAICLIGMVVRPLPRSSS